jgi:anaerobic selenocysteine-containing dehydrogenase
VTVFQLLAERYLDPQYAPEAIASRCGVPASTIKRIAAEIATAALDSGLALDVPWTDWAGRTHPRMEGRPLSIHAMRGISAHSNGFHTCRALHLLQMLLGAIDAPGSYRHRPPYPRPIPPPIRPAGHAHQIAPGKIMAGPPLGFPLGPEDLLVEPDGSPRRIDKAYSWEAPLAAHGMMHMVIANAHAGDPYPIDTLFLYMANMSWNSSMNVDGVHDMLTDRDPATGEYRIPRIIYSDAYFSEMVAYADLVLPDTTYLERWDCISLLDRPISSADGPADAIRRPVVAPDRDVRPFQDVLLELGVRLSLPGLVRPDGTPRYPGGYPDYIALHERAPGIGLLAGWRGEKGASHGTGRPNPDQLARYVENQCFWSQELPEDQRFFRHLNRGYLDHAARMGWIPTPEPIILQIYSEPLQRFRLAAQGHGPVQPPDRLRARIAAHFDPLPIWYAPFEDETADADRYDLHAITQRPMAMYHSWGAQNAWLRQIHGTNRLYVARARAKALGLADGDVVRIESRHGAALARIRLMEGVNEDTVWTWNAIGKRRGAWNLAPDAPESRGFLLNHLIAELLPAQPDGHRYAASDPITGQAAWYDLRVRIERVTGREAERLGDTRPALAAPPGLALRPAILRHGARFRFPRAAEDGA